MRLTTHRLDLLPSTMATLNAELEGRDALAGVLGADVAEGWPPDLYTSDNVTFILDRLVQNPGEVGWWLWYVLLRRDGERPVVIGTAGYKGPPSEDGMVEIGYSIVNECQHQGYATEAARALIARAFALPEVTRVIAETLPDLAPSIGVLRRCGFRFIGDGSEPGVIRYELLRAEWPA